MVAACLRVSLQAQQINHRYESRNRAAVSQSQLIMAGYTIRALLLRLHSPHKSPTCKGEPQLSSTITSSSVRLLWRRLPQLVIFVCTLPCESSYPISPCSRVSCHTGFPRAQPVFCPTLLSRIFATCRSVCIAAVGGRRASLAWSEAYARY